MNNSIKKWAKGLNRHHIEEDMQMENKHIKRRSTLYVIRELQMKESHITTQPLERLKSKILTIPIADVGAEQQNSHSLTVSMQND